MGLAEALDAQKSNSPMGIGGCVLLLTFVCTINCALGYDGTSEGTGMSLGEGVGVIWQTSDEPRVPPLPDCVGVAVGKPGGGVNVDTLAGVVSPFPKGVSVAVALPLLGEPPDEPPPHATRSTLSVATANVANSAHLPRRRSRSIAAPGVVSRRSLCCIFHLSDRYFAIIMIA